MVLRKRFDAIFPNLGEIIVPDNYHHETALRDLAENNRRMWVNRDKYFGTYLPEFNSYLTDSNFNKPSRILYPGDRLQVEIFIIAPCLARGADVLDFLISRGAVFPGAQGIPLVFGQKRELLPRGKWYLSLDHEDALLKVRDESLIPSLVVNSGGGYCFDTAGYRSVFGNTHESDAVLCFTEV